MVNMYVLGLASSPPSGWTAVTTYNGRYVRFTTSTSQHGATGGADQHRHLSAATTSGDSSSVGGAGEFFIVLAAHTHSIPSAYSSYSNNDPSYYTYALWRIDLATWEANIRRFPANTVVLAKAPISCTGMSRFSNGDGRLIKLGSPGSTGGRTTHTDHSCTVTLESKSAQTQVSMSRWDINLPANKDHGHTATVNSVPSNTVLPKRVSMRFYRVTSETDKAPKDVVCFFDGTPTSNWTSLGYGDVFPICEDDSLTVSGSDEHGHAGASATSSSYSITTHAYQSGSTPYPTPSHTHPATITLTSTNHVPLYVSLCPYYLNTTLYWKVTRTKTWTMDHVLKVVKTASTVIDTRAKRVATKTWTMDHVLKVENIVLATMDVLAQREDTKTWTMDHVLAQSEDTKTLTMDVLAKREDIKPWTMDHVLVVVGTVLATMDVLAQKEETKTWTMDHVIVAAKTALATMDVRAKREATKQWTMDVWTQRERLIGVGLTAGLLDTASATIWYGLELSDRPRPYVPRIAPTKYTPVIEAPDRIPATPKWPRQEGYRSKTVDSFRTVGGPEGRGS